MKLDLEGGFPISESATREALQLVAKQMHARYTSPFTLVIVLPQAAIVGKILYEELLRDGAHPFLAPIGSFIVDESGKQRAVVVDPPSEHVIKKKKVVIFDGQGDMHQLLSASKYIAQLGPRTVEVGSLFLKVDKVPDWINPDYVSFLLDKDVVVSGLGLGYNQDAVNGAALVAERREVSREQQPEVAPVDAPSTNAVVTPAKEE